MHPIISGEPGGLASRAYIFDLDGTLLDSANVWNRINRHFFEKRGIPFPCDYQQTIAAMPFPQVAVYTKETYRLPETPEQLMEEFLSMSVDCYAREVDLKPGAKDYLTRLKKAGCRMAVATAAPYDLLTPALCNHGIFDLFDAICTTQEAGHGKTSPAVFLLAAQRINAKPGECIVFDDILAAVESAKGAGMTVCGVRDIQSEAMWAAIQQIADYTITDFTDIYF
ncbi:MAG: HAD family phosphatase [Defluviitaleaceae bacterium]|nr:HAD family phosphatase [Defluviitaleaceae bacterium]MCL2239497.1 HAD family phosphatase [Defluviitaleaceae bacterium]